MLYVQSNIWVYCFSIVILVIGFWVPGTSQITDNQLLKAQVEKYKSDPRGPYKDIRWFCKDGSFSLPKEQCPEGGVERARYKPEVDSLGETRHIFLGQILATTPHEAFWDEPHFNARLKQYLLEKYLRTIDDGWILQKAQYYKGAFQMEDEEIWGVEFLNWLLSKNDPVEKQYYLLRQAVKDIPHQGFDDKAQRMRALAKTIADLYPSFTDLRLKMQGQPELSIIKEVLDFKQRHLSKIQPEVIENLNQLTATLEAIFNPFDLNKFIPLLEKLPKDHGITQSLTNYVQLFKNEKNSMSRAMAAAEQLALIRQELASVPDSGSKLAILNISVLLEEVFIKQIKNWQAINIKDLSDKICYTGLAAMGTGLIEIWEWDVMVNHLAGIQRQQMSLKELHQYLQRARNLFEWGTGMVNGVYKDVVFTFAGFEPLANGFLDIKVQRSVLNSLGNTIGRLRNFITMKSNFTSSVLNLPNQNTFRGLNPGVAFGELEIINNYSKDIIISKDKIYVFRDPPPDLNPVAGILTVTEGNMVSHVQLLAQNFDIPNAVLAEGNMSWLLRYSGQKMFFAVSNKRTVIMKQQIQMTAEEKALFSVKNEDNEKVAVPISTIDLEQKNVLDIQELNSTSSGKICGSKALNLGQLKLMHPDNVIPGIVLPFGIFKMHMEQPMPDQNASYWEFLNTTFSEANELRDSGKTEEILKVLTLNRFDTLRTAIKKMDLLPAFLKDLEEQFQKTFDTKMGQLPVSLSGETNMEDLKTFSREDGHPSLFNEVDKGKIIQAIKEIWAASYTEQSLNQRHQYLLNPENIFPSILITKVVDVDYSGVLITKGISTNDSRDLTTAFNRGANRGGDPHAKESYLLHHGGNNQLLSPAREPFYTTYPETGGTNQMNATFETRILNDQNLYDLRILVLKIQQEVPGKTEMQNPFELALGFKEDKIWVFQIRPFVANKNALTLNYLESISPNIDDNKLVLLNEVFN